MAKRRRERDRPKHHPGGLNPNKRVLLSYEDDDDTVFASAPPAWGSLPESTPSTPQQDAYESPNNGEAEKEVATGTTSAVPRQDARETSSDGFDEKEQYPETVPAVGQDTLVPPGDCSDEEEQATKTSLAVAQQNAQERASDSSGEKDPAIDTYEDSYDDMVATEPDDEDEDEGLQHPSTSKAAISKDSWTRQVPVIGNQPSDASSDIDQEEHAKAVTYLKSVMSEREGVSHSSPESTVTTRFASNRNAADGLRWYGDQGYIAGRLIGPVLPTERQRSMESRAAFSESLKKQFLSLRRELRRAPSDAALKALDDDHPIAFDQRNQKANGKWVLCLKTTAPVYAQVQSLKQDTVVRLLELIYQRVVRKKKPIVQHVSAWIWCLLARLDDVSALFNEEVAVVRELGKHAVLVSLSLSAPEVAQQLEDARGERVADEQQSCSDLDEANPAFGQDKDSGSLTSPEGLPGEELMNTFATLDMILVIVGDVFGQRDLLQHRSNWPNGHGITLHCPRRLDLRATAKIVPMLPPAPGNLWRAASGPSLLFELGDLHSSIASAASPLVKMPSVSELVEQHRPNLSPLKDLYKHLHRTPELSNQEKETASTIVERLKDICTEFDIRPNIGGFGIAALLYNGSGPTILLRADFDGLPVEEKTGLDYASTKRMTDRDGVEKPVMHACGHDMHVTCLLGAAQLLVSARDSWAGTLLLAFQPAEERGTGAQAMVDDGMYDSARHSVPLPDVVLGGHVFPFRAGVLGTRRGLLLSSADSMRVTLHGRGAHASMPNRSIDPVVMAASTIMKLQTIVSREVDPAESAVVTVASVQAGDAENVICDDAKLAVDIRTTSQGTREKVLASVRRICCAESIASSAVKEPTFEPTRAFPLTINDDEITKRLEDSFAACFTSGKQGYRSDIPSMGGSEDFSILGTAINRPCSFFLYGGVDPEIWDKAEQDGTLDAIPINHSALFAPVIMPTLQVGLDAYAVAALTWLAKK